MLCCKFKDRPGERKILSGRYLIMNAKVPGETISKDDWNLVVHPGAQLQMSIVLVRSYSEIHSCPRPGCMGATVDVSTQLPSKGSTVEWSVPFSMRIVTVSY